MHPRITELLQYIERETEVLKAAYHAVPPEKRGLRADPKRWSPAEVVQHVAMVDGRLTQRIAGLIEQARGMPPETETSSVLTGPVTRAVDRTTRITTSEALEP